MTVVRSEAKIFINRRGTMVQPGETLTLIRERSQGANTAGSWRQAAGSRQRSAEGKQRAAVSSQPSAVGSCRNAAWNDSNIIRHPGTSWVLPIPHSPKAEGAPLDPAQTAGATLLCGVEDGRQPLPNRTALGRIRGAAARPSRSGTRDAGPGAWGGLSPCRASRARGRAFPANEAARGTLQPLFRTA